MGAHWAALVAAAKAAMTMRLRKNLRENSGSEGSKKIKLKGVMSSIKDFIKSRVDNFFDSIAAHNFNVIQMTVATEMSSVTTSIYSILVNSFARNMQVALHKFRSKHADRFNKNNNGYEKKNSNIDSDNNIKTDINPKVKNEIMHITGANRPALGSENEIKKLPKRPNYPQIAPGI